MPLVLIQTKVSSPSEELTTLTSLLQSLEDSSLKFSVTLTKLTTPS